MDETNTQRIDRALESYGADPARWPAADRALPRHAADPAAVTAAAEIDHVLGRATQPVLPPGFEQRLLARLTPPAASNVVTLGRRPAARPRPVLPWLAALPLAASLALGIYLGAAGTLDPLLPAAVTGDVAAGDDDSDPSGIGIATDYSADNLS